MGIIDQTLPTDGGSRFLEIHPHYNFHLSGEFLPQGRQLCAVFKRSLYVMDRARTGHYQQPGIFLLQYSRDILAAGHDRPVGGFGSWQLCFKRVRR